VNPIVIVDEPQNFETDVRRSALMDLNPLCTLRYSATHKNPYNLLYSLNPVQAYDLGLVKQIEVDGVLADDDQNQAFVELLSIDAKSRGITAKVRIDVNDKSGPKRKELTLKLGEDLYVKSSMRDVYLDGYILNEIRADDGEIEFSGGRVLRVNEAQGGLTDDVMRFQIERTRRMLQAGAPLGRAIDGRIGLELRLIVMGGARILEKLSAVDGDVFRRRPVLRTLDAPLLLWRALTR
jgi:type III restriction enzyme